MIGFSKSKDKTFLAGLGIVALMYSMLEFLPLGVGSAAMMVCLTMVLGYQYWKVRTGRDDVPSSKLPDNKEFFSLRFLIGAGLFWIAMFFMGNFSLEMVVIPVVFMGLFWFGMRFVDFRELDPLAPGPLIVTGTCFVAVAALVCLFAYFGIRALQEGAWARAIDNASSTLMIVILWLTEREKNRRHSPAFGSPQPV